MAMADCILANLVQQLGGLVYEEYKVLRDAKDELKFLEKELRFMKIFLRNSEGKQQEHPSVRELVHQIKEVAFEAEDVIETFLLNVETQNQRNTILRAVHHYTDHKAMLYEVGKQIKGIKTSIDNIYVNKEKYGIEIGDGSIDPHFVAALERRRKQVVDEEMVGFVDEAHKLLSQLTDGSTHHLEIISIVGMGGLGKTTVAKSLYNNRIIRDHFTNRAWVSVSEDYDTRQIILTILNNMLHHIDNFGKQATDELKKILKTHLMKRKYIVILDDVWQTNTWDEIEACFPDQRNGSRVLITTRNAQVARRARPNKEPHYLRLLEENESWELFAKKIFRGDLCPAHLKPLGKKIVQRCKGIPLSIVVIASMLASQEMSERIWERTLKDVRADLGKDEACKEILALSYHSLPAVLKPCFLYFAVFPEDYEISARRLIALWLAEGFIQPHGEWMLEDVADLYLESLVDRSLVQAGMRRTTDGGLKTCRIHDLIRGLCIRQAERENFMLPVSKLSATGSSVVSKSKPRRLSVHCRTQDTVLSNDCVFSSIRAFLSFELQMKSVSPAFWNKLYTDYKLLRVLDLGNAIRADNKMPKDFEKLANLRYLRFHLATDIPRSIYNLRNLQMLFLMGGGAREIPMGALLKLQSLQQLNVDDNSATLCGYSKALLLKKQLNNLRVLSGIWSNSDFEDAVTNGLCPNLRKLSMSFSRGSLKKYFANLAYLQSLKVRGYYPDACCDIFEGIRVAELPSNLTKITLKHLEWCNKSFNVLGGFPNLRVLKLFNLKGRAASNHEEDVCFKLRDGLFPELHTLHLVNVYCDSLALPSSGENKLPNIFGQLRALLIHSCKITIFDRNLFKLPSLKDVQVLLPDSRLAACLEELKKNNEIKYRLLIYRGNS